MMMLLLQLVTVAVVVGAIVVCTSCHLLVNSVTYGATLPQSHPLPCFVRLLIGSCYFEGSIDCGSINCGRKNGVGENDVICQW